MNDPRTDAQLVAAHLAGDRSALAGVYDRYGPGLYDTAAAMLRDRHEAADAAHDVFLMAAERLSQLRDPERLKPWLFAILRNEVYRRTRRRGRALPTDFSATEIPDVATDHDPTADAGTDTTADLAALVRSAACGLDERDQLVLELSVRQGLQGADLAAALGVTPEQSYTLVHRMRERVDRSMGALVVARAGRKDCPELDEVLRGWDGEFSVLIRKRVARHVEQCETCERTKRKVAPLALLSAAPAFAAPLDLRDRVLDSVARGVVPPRTYRFDMSGGFPRVARHLSRLLLAICAGTGALLLGGAGVLVAGSGDDSPASSGAVATEMVTIDSGATDTGAPDSAPSTSVADSSTSSSTSSSSTSTTSTVPPGVLEVSTGTVDLGPTKDSGTFRVRNTGGTAITWSSTGSPAPFTLSSTGGVLEPGAERSITVQLVRANLIEGDIAAGITVRSSTGASRSVRLVAKVVRPPTVALTNAPSGNLTLCTLTAPPIVSATWSDDSGITTTPVLSWWGPTSGQTTLSTTSASSGYGSIIVSTAQPGTYGFRVTATDVWGNEGSAGGTFSLVECQIIIGGASPTGR